MRPEDFADRTRADWIAFDSYKEQAMQETQAEREAAEQQQELSMRQQVKNKLDALGVTVDMDNVQKMYRQYFLKNKEKLNECLGDDERLKDVLAHKIANEATLREFAQFVLQY